MRECNSACPGGKSSLGPYFNSVSTYLLTTWFRQTLWETIYSRLQTFSGNNLHRNLMKFSSPGLSMNWGSLGRLDGSFQTCLDLLRTKIFSQFPEKVETLKLKVFLRFLPNNVISPLFHWFEQHRYYCFSEMHNLQFKF